MNDLNISQKPAARTRSGGLLALFLLAALPALVTPLRADSPPTYLFQIDASTVPGGFFTPAYVALDGSNNLYVSDYYDNVFDINVNCILKFAANGSYLTQWGAAGSGIGQFDYTSGVAVDSSDNIYAGDPGNYRIEKFTSSGSYLTKWGSDGSGNGQFALPAGVAVDSNMNVYVVDIDNNRVEKFTSNGTYLAQWGSDGNSNGQFAGPAGIAIDTSNNVYVIDSGNARVQKFTSNGTYLGQWGNAGTGSGQFEFGFLNPNGIAVDGSNNVYVADYGNYRIEKFTSNGDYLTQWGSYGTAPGQFQGPQGIALDSTGNFIYVADSLSIQVFVNNTNVIPPFITTQPSNQIVPAGTNVTFSFGVVGGEPFAYQWTSNDLALSGATNATFTLTNVSLSASGNYSLLVTNNYGRVVSSNALLTVVPAIVTSQPISQVVLGGATVTFSVGIVSVAPPTFQWSFNNVAVSGATNITFTLTNVSPAASGNYSEVITNSYGSVVSSNALLTVFPAMVITQPASSISDTGAVLNGSVILGSDETVAWFEWGTDTNYGNIAGESILPGNNETNDISTNLSGLPGNIYHYRIDAANDFGIVYGNDQVFTVGLAPTVTTLAAVISTNGATLNATVNPNGWETTVYFRWGVAPGPLSNSTPLADIGAGAVSLNVSSFITGLAPAKQYNFQIVASNHLGTFSGAQVAFYSPPFVSVPNENWDSVASSADGSVLVAVANKANGASPAGPIIISTNSGATWVIATGAPTNGFWETVACSADGSKIIAAGGGGGSFLFPIYTSPDMGETWVSNNAPVFNWQSVASSADGTRLVAAAELNRVIYTSMNSGAVWTQATNAPKLSWFSVALSADGTKLAAVANGSANIFTSPDFGTTWKTNNVPRGPEGLQGGFQLSWNSIASSADGSKLIAAAGANGIFGYIFISTNSGTIWQVTATNMVSGLSAHPWIGVASSADGSKLAAVSDVANSPLGVVITSTNSGATWTTNAVPSLDWNAVALSADGAKLVATVGYPSTGPIYVSQTTPAPVLSLAPVNGQPTVSWIIPSMSFTLQQSSDLSNWTDMTNVPVLNFTNLENQVALPSPVGSNFFRLKH